MLRTLPSFLHRRAAAFTVLLTLALAQLASAQQTVAAPGVHPLSGRRFAQVMGYQGADWLDRDERVDEEQPDMALDAIRIAAGSTVADVGAGSGYMTARLARRVGAAGRVYAKTGSLSHVSALSGYIHRMNGSWVAFSILVNNYNVRAADIRGVMDRICNLIVE